MKLPYLVAAVAAVLTTLSSPSLAHARLETSSPQANSVVGPAPAQVRLHFSEPLELPFSKVMLVDEKGARVDATKIAAEPANPRILVATIPALHAGAYRVQWTVVTRDGHKIRGDFGFRVK